MRRLGHAQSSPSLAHDSTTLTQSDAARGIRLLCAGVFVFSLQDAVVKQVTGNYPLTEVMTIRSIVAIPILLVMVQLEAGWRAIFTPQFRSLVLRAGLMFGAYTSYYMAFPAMNLAYAVALYFTVPLFVTALAGPFLGERIGIRVWTALAVGFSGIIVILQPGSGLFEWAALLSLTSALMYATSMLMARRIGTAQPASVMTFYQNWVFLAGALVIAAMVAATAAGLYPSLDAACVAMPQGGRERRPDAAARLHYDKDYKIFLEMLRQRQVIDAMV